MKRKNGFTLLEILVALAILSLVSLALTTTGSTAVDNAGYLKVRTLATWVAMNTAAELELAGEWIPLSAADGEAEMADTKWFTKVTGHETPHEAIRRGVIEVRQDRAAENPLANFTVFMRRPADK